MTTTLPHPDHDANEPGTNYVRGRRRRRALTWALSDLRRGRRTPRQTLDLLRVDQGVRNRLGAAIFRYAWRDGDPLDVERSPFGRPVFERACVGLYLLVLESVRWGGRRPRALGPIVGEAKAAKQLGVSRRMVVHAKRALEKAGVLRGWQPPAEAVPEWARCRPKRDRDGGERQWSYWCVELCCYCGDALRRRLQRFDQAAPSRAGPLVA